MYNYDRDELRKIQEKKLEMLVDIASFCENNNITYWLDSGTLLGAIRHGGFIPWDDDIDIIVMQEDAKFLKENYKSENFEIVNTNEEGINFYKVISKKDQVQVGESIAELDIDIFLVTSYPDSYALKFWNSFFHLKKNRIEKFSLTLFFTNILINLKRKLEKTKLFNYKNIEKKIFYILDEAKKKNKAMPNIAYTPDCGFYLIIWREEEIFPLKKIKFEGIEFNSPNNYDTYLKKMYHSYMDLPPKEKRIPDHYQDKELKLIIK